MRYRKYLGDRVVCYNGSDQSRYAPSHWLGEYLDWSLYWMRLHCAEAYCSGHACCSNDKEVCMHPQQPLKRNSTKIGWGQLPWQQWDFELKSRERILFAWTEKISVTSYKCSQWAPYQLPVSVRSYWDCSNSIANALDLLQSCTKPSLCCEKKNTFLIDHQWRWDGAVVMRRCVCTHNIHYEGMPSRQGVGKLPKLDCYTDYFTVLTWLL